jgi:hypothetical protein
MHIMEIQGHIQNGVAVPDGGLPLPEGAKVVIVIPSAATGGDVMSAEAKARYLEALARIDAVANENPGDNFSGADHDQVLYGDRE